MKPSAIVIGIIFACSFSRECASQVLSEEADSTSDSTRETSFIEELNEFRFGHLYDLLMKRLDSMKGSSQIQTDFFVLGETNGRFARFYVIQSGDSTARKVVEITANRSTNRWHVYGRTDSASKAKRIVSSARNRYVASIQSQRPRIG